MIRRDETIIYVPISEGIDADERWDIVAASLRAAGFVNVLPAPMPAQRFKPRHARTPLPVMIGRVEV
jgi:hypothetical protein